MARELAHIDLSVIVPCYNEDEVLPLLKDRLGRWLNQQGLSWEVILVDDGSSDRSFDQLAAMHAEDGRFKVIGLSRNFGHQAAISVGLRAARGEAVAVMDADLQDPPELLGRCLDKVRDGFDVAYAVRRKRKESLLKRAAYRAYYRILNLVADTTIAVDSGDFCVMTRRVVAVMLRLPERNLFVRGMRSWAGFRQIGIEYERDARAAGQTKYSFGRLLRLGADGVFAFSLVPLRLATFAGLFIVIGCVAAGSLVVAWRLAGIRFMGHSAAELPGWTAIIIVVLLLGAGQLLVLGLIGEYVGRIYAEVKRRPRWVVREALGLAPEHDEPESRGYDRDVV